MVLDLYMSGKLDLDRLKGSTYPLHRINEAFGDMLAGHGARTLIDVT